MKKYSNLAIMCAEAVPWRCHRRLIVDYLIMVEGINVFDILNSKKLPVSHELTSFADLTDDKIIACSTLDGKVFIYDVAEAIDKATKKTGDMVI
jgi:uncharacterized protein (DUF488 family)